MRVGWRLTSVARNEANSEYLRRTSMPYAPVQLTRMIAVWGKIKQTYPCAYGVCYVAASALEVLAGIGDEDGGFGILIQPLLDSAVVAALLVRGVERADAGTGTRLATAGGKLIVIVIVVVDIAHGALRVVVGGIEGGGVRVGRRRRGAIGHWQ